MPFKAPRICSCGRKVAFGVMCACQIDRKAEVDKRRPNARQRGYDTKWQKARTGFLQKHPNCAMCGQPATVVDHIQRHAGDMHKFWDSKNWQSLCTHHHNSTKQSIER